MERSIEILQSIASWFAAVAGGLSSEFWSGIIGAVVGAVVGGCISYVLQRQASREGRNQRSEDHMRIQRGLASHLLFKVVRIHSNFVAVHNHIEGCFDKAETDRFGGEPWQFVLPLATFAEPVHLTSDEMSMVLGLKDNYVFHKVFDLDVLHNGLVDATKIMSSERRALCDHLRLDEWSGNILSGKFNQEAHLALKPKMIEVNSLIEQVRMDAKRGAIDSLAALDLLRKLFRERLRLTYRFESKFAPPPNTGIQ